tara:strand:+ start:2788 stop:3330 length:543 start_codon:yes stop_codon:yes gene_type:complete
MLTAADLHGEGLRGSAKDRLDWPGSPTDRYLDVHEVAGVLELLAADFAACITREHAARFTAEPLWIAFSVSAEGASQAAQLVGQGATVDGPGLRDHQLPPAVATCFLELLTQQRFPDHDGPALRYSYPLVFMLEQERVRNLPYPLVFASPPQHPPLPLLSLPLSLSSAQRRQLEATLSRP